jgi:hypothetical protein
MLEYNVRLNSTLTIDGQNGSNSFNNDDSAVLTGFISIFELKKIEIYTNTK